MLALVVAIASAQAPQWTVTVDPLTTYLGFVHLQTELALSDRVSFYASPSLKLFDAPGTEQEPYRGLGVEVGLRYFWGRQNGNPACVAPCGPWVMVRGVFADVRTTDGTEESDFGRYTSALVGHSWIFDSQWTVQLGAGVQHMDYTVADYGISGWLPALHTNVGIAF